MRCHSFLLHRFLFHILNIFHRNSQTKTAIAEVWPWQGSDYRDDIKEVVVEEGVAAGGRIRHMFSNMPNLEKVDLSNMDSTKIGMANDVFRGSANLKEIIFSQDFAPQQMYRTFRDCTALTTVQFGTEEKPYNPQLASSRASNTSAFGDSNNNIGVISTCFSGCTSLTTLKFPNADLSENSDKWTNRVTNLVTIFNNANSNDKTIEMNGAKLSSALSNGVFRQSTLKELYLQDAEITRNNLSQLFHSGDTSAAPKLETVDMTGISFKPESESGRINAYGLFRSLPALKEVILSNADFDNAQNFNQMFQDSAELKTLRLDGVKITEAVKMFNMFKGCTGLEELDISSFGSLEHIVSMQDMFKGCTNLKVLNISNVDNSHIQPKNGNHPANAEGGDPGGIAQNVDWNRNLALDTCTSLEWLIADNSTVWMTANSKGNPGDEYFNAATDIDGNGNPTFYYFSEKQMDLYQMAPADLDAPGAALVKLETRRDYIDLMTDRNESGTRANGQNESASNINTKAGHLNVNGAGFLAPITYHVLSDSWKQVEAPLQDTFYHIDKDKLAAATPVVTVENGQGLVQTDSGVKTETRTKEAWEGNSKIDGPIEGGEKKPLITLTYKDIAVDVNGKAHDVIVKVNTITFTNLGSITTRPGGRIHDGNRYIDDPDTAGSYYRDVLSYGQGYLRFNNYAKRDSDDKTIIKGDAGTNIDFSIEVDGAAANSSILFYIDDLDIPASQQYVQHATDGDFDTLDWVDVDYTDHSEGIVLREGNDTDTLRYADHTGLAKDSKTIGANTYTYIHGTGSDPSASNDTKSAAAGYGSTGWSAFSVKADAAKSNYTWVS